MGPKRTPAGGPRECPASWYGEAIPTEDIADIARHEPAEATPIPPEAEPTETNNPETSDEADKGQR